MEEILITPCGMNCGLCTNYQAKKNDLKQKGFLGIIMSAIFFLANGLNYLISVTAQNTIWAWLKILLSSRSKVLELFSKIKTKSGSALIAPARFAVTTGCAWTAVLISCARTENIARKRNRNTIKMISFSHFAFESNKYIKKPCSNMQGFLELLVRIELTTFPLRVALKEPNIKIEV